MTATPEHIVWVALNAIGVIVWGWLAFISWERRIAIIVDKRSLIRQQRLRTVTKQIRNRAVGAISHIFAIIIGIFPMFGIHLPANGSVWIGIFIVFIIITIATIDLYGEFRSS